MAWRGAAVSLCMQSMDDWLIVRRGRERLCFLLAEKTVVFFLKTMRGKQKITCLPVCDSVCVSYFQQDFIQKCLSINFHFFGNFVRNNFYTIFLKILLQCEWQFSNLLGQRKIEKETQQMNVTMTSADFGLNFVRINQ